QQDARIVVTGPHEAADSQIRVKAIVRCVESAEATQGIAQGSPSVAADVGGGKDADRGRRPACIFKMPRALKTFTRDKSSKFIDIKSGSTCDCEAAEAVEARSATATPARIRPADLESFISG